ncbi:MAG: trypsin-like peptidase domain-containing protein [Gammaproteobacteria bacterium]|nr:trypsin-like peptidase domain-containing protein [Gammaproteobacteria bacterium]
MTNKLHSTHFMIGWALVGLTMALLILIFWPEPATDGNHHTGMASMEGPVSYAAAVNKAASAVVSIQALQKADQRPSLLAPLQNRNQAPGNPFRPNHGSGVIISANGHILTNYHVIANADVILVNLHDGRQGTARLLGSDPDTDLAVLTTDMEHLPNISFADSKKTQVGDVVLAIGNPFGIGQTVTQGIISATGRNRVGLNTYENFFQTDAAINPGNSGGALVNAYGDIIGINSAIFSDTGNYQGIGFAIPIDMAISVVKQIIEYGGVIRGWLGVEGVDLNAQILKRIGLPGVQGVLITDVFKHGPGDKGGLMIGDIITQINQTPIRDTRDVLDIVARGRPGDNIEIRGIRQRQSYITHTILAQRPQESN